MTLWASLGANLVAVAVLVFALYFPRHRRRDMIPALLIANVGVMAVTATIATANISLGFGLGIFAVLSIMRLRSRPMDHAEIAYYFAAIALGLLAGFPAPQWWASLALMGLVIVAMTVGDHPKLFARSRRQVVVVNRVVTNEADAAETLAKLLNARVHRVSIVRTNVVNGTTECDVRYSVD